MSSQSTSADDANTHWMREAIDLAVLGEPSPNPHVGAVVVADGQIVGRGHHDRAGGDHAEVVALRDAGSKAAGATLYVTLEPCNHTGRTPPCTDAIIASSVARVVIGCRDPNPHVEGGGLERLKSARIVVDVGVCNDVCERLIAPWSKYVTTGLPYVTLKLALSLDGRIATRTGASKWVTGPEARARVHLIRAANDAVAVGIGTALADDPRLTVRDAPGRSPVRVVFDTSLRTAPTLRLVQSASTFPTWILAGPDAPAEREIELAAAGVEIIRCPVSTEGRIDAFGALRILASRGVVTLMVEGGAELAGSMLAGQFADELHAFVAPILLGPRGRPGAVDWAGPTEPGEAPRIDNPTWEVCGGDAHVFGTLRYPDR